MGRRKGKSPSYSSRLELALPRPLTATQALLARAIVERDLIITLGPSGTGKTYLPSCYAAYAYKKDSVKKIIVTRPNVPVGRSLGCIPGTMQEKLDPWARPILDVLEAYLTRGAIETMLKLGSLEVAPFETIRGRSWSDAFIILDEAQNTTKEEIKAFVTRIGEGSTVVINGDIRQSDLRDSRANGLSYLIDLVNNNDSLKELCSVVEFNSDDIVRSELCRRFVKAMEGE